MADHRDPGEILNDHRSDEDRVSGVLRTILDGRKAFGRTVQADIITRLDRFIEVGGGFRRPFRLHQAIKIGAFRLR